MGRLAVMFNSSMSVFQTDRTSANLVSQFCSDQIDAVSDGPAPRFRRFVTRKRNERMRR